MAVLGQGMRHAAGIPLTPTRKFLRGTDKVSAFARAHVQCLLACIASTW
jgi:hypothetical protein